MAIVRPTYVIGAYDATLRFPYWVERARRGGVIAVPGPRVSAMQYVDARDLANFIVGLAENGVTDEFHAAGPNPCAEYVDVIERVARHVGPEGTASSSSSPSASHGPASRGSSRCGPAGATRRDSRWTRSRPSSTGCSCAPSKTASTTSCRGGAGRDWPDRWLSADEEHGLLA